MNIISNLANQFGKAFVPEKFRPKMRTYFAKAAIRDIPYTKFGYLFYVSVIVTLVVYGFFWSWFVDFTPIALMIWTFVFFFIVELIFSILVMAGIYIYVDVKIFQRTKAIEKVLPDFLGVVSENLKTGMTLDQALWSAVKPEFGVLSNEIQITAKRVATGEDIGKALVGFSEKYHSTIVRRAMLLVVEGVRGGGEVAVTIDRTVDNLRETAALKEQMLGNAINFVIFISIIVIFISPGLFALAFVLLQVLKGFSAQLGQSSSIASFFSFSDIAVSLEDFKLFSQLAIATISFFAAMIVANISKGDIRSGLKYVPVFVGTALGMYVILLNLLLAVFGQLFKF